MAFVVSSLTNYVSEQSKDLLTAAMFGSETASYANLQTGIKSAEKLQLMSNTLTMQDGTVCTFNPLGDTTFSQRQLTVGSIAYHKEWCPQDLEPKWNQITLKKGSNYSESDLAKEILDDQVKIMNKNNDVADWKGDTTSGDANLNKYDGLVKTINAASGVVNVNAGFTVNTTNIRSVLRSAIAAVPAALKHDPDFMFFTGYDVLDIYQNSLSTDNAFNIWGTEANTGEIKIENTVYKLKAVHGLDGQLSTTGSTFIVGLKPADNLFLGVDLENDHEQFKLWESLDNGGKIRMSVRFKRGWQVAYPTEIVTVKNQA